MLFNERLNSSVSICAREKNKIVKNNITDFQHTMKYGFSWLSIILENTSAYVRAAILGLCGRELSILNFIAIY